MGVHILAIAVWLGSIALYGAAFFFPEVHRRHDFFWSGVGSFYGLVLWFCAVQTSSTELLGHTASVVLLGWLGWQTLSLRRKRSPLDLQTPLTQDSWPTFGRKLKQSALNLLRSTFLSRWLPKREEGSLPGDPAIAISEIRVSSLKDVDYEFVDELFVDESAASPRPSPSEPFRNPIPVSSGVKAARLASPAVTASRQRSMSQTQPVSMPTQTPRSPKPATVGARLAGFKAWVGDLFKAKTTPKPKRAVIDIPPRPSPLAKQKSQPTPGNAPSPDQPGGVNIIDAEATESFEESRDLSGDGAITPADRSSSVESTLSETMPSTQSDGRNTSTNATADTEVGNWPDDLDEIFPDRDASD